MKKNLRLIGKRGATAALTGVAVVLMAASVAWACTVSVPQDPPGLLTATPAAAFPGAVVGVEVGPIEPLNLATKGTHPVLMNATAGSPTDTTNRGCDGQGDTTVGTVTYGVAGNGNVIGVGTATIPSGWTPGTYEMCAQPEPRHYWNHFQVLI